MTPEELIGIDAIFRAGYVAGRYSRGKDRQEAKR